MSLINLVQLRISKKADVRKSKMAKQFFNCKQKFQNLVISSCAPYIITLFYLCYSVLSELHNLVMLLTKNKTPLRNLYNLCTHSLPKLYPTFLNMHECYMFTLQNSKLEAGLLHESQQMKVYDDFVSVL